MIQLNLYKKIIIVCSFLFIHVNAFAQNRSAFTETIDGKKFYIHTIEKGQSLFSISKLYNVSLEDIYKYNPELKTTGAKVDQEIKIPFTQNTSIPVSGTVNLSALPAENIDTTRYITHKVAKGETVYAITKKFQVSEKQLASFNPGLTPASLKEGQLIIVGEKVKPKVQTHDFKSTPTKSEKSNKEEKVIKPSDPVRIKDSLHTRPVTKSKKTNYKLGIILPFRFEQTLSLDLAELTKSNGNFPNVPGLAVDFYLGVQKAIDSLKTSNFDVELKVYESDDKDSLLISQIINDPDFKHLDLIFGPLYANGFKIISKHAKEFGIPIVSPSATQNKILYDNIYISKTNPSHYTLIESLADYCIDSLLNSETAIYMVVLSDKDKKEMSYVTAFKKYFTMKQRKLGHSTRDTITTINGITNLKSQYKANKKNIVVVLSNNQVFLSDLTTQLSMMDTKNETTLCGWQSLSESDNIDQEYLNQLKYVFPSACNLTNLSAFKTLDQWYAGIQNTTPGEYFYMGFDIGYYYLTQLKTIGPDFVYQLNSLPVELNYLRFNFTRPDKQTGFDNRGVYIFKYSNYHLQKTGWH